jgi:hypothetical protein
LQQDYQLLDKQYKLAKQEAMLQKEKKDEIQQHFLKVNNPKIFFMTKPPPKFSQPPKKIIFSTNTEPIAHRQTHTRMWKIDRHYQQIQRSISKRDRTIAPTGSPPPEIFLTTSEPSCVQRTIRSHATPNSNDL